MFVDYAINYTTWLDSFILELLSLEFIYEYDRAYKSANDINDISDNI